MARPEILPAQTGEIAAGAAELGVEMPAAAKLALDEAAYDGAEDDGAEDEFLPEDVTLAVQNFPASEAEDDGVAADILAEAILADDPLAGQLKADESVRHAPTRRQRVPDCPPSTPEEQAHFDEVYRKTHGIVFGLLRGMLRDRDAAQDAMQEVYLRAWRKWKTFIGDDDHRLSWIKTIAHRHAIDCIRAAKNRREELTDLSGREGEIGGNVHAANRAVSFSRNMYGASAENLEYVAEQIRSHKPLIALLRGLPPERAAAVVAVYLCDRSFEEHAAATGTAVTTVKSRLQRAKDHMVGQVGVASAMLARKKGHGYAEFVELLDRLPDPPKPDEPPTEIENAGQTASADNHENPDE